MSREKAEKRQRLFFALWPDEDVRSGLEQSAKQLLGKRVKRVAADNLHITLAFAGAVDAQQHRCLEAAAGEFRGPCFELCIDRAGHWPKPRIVWAAPTRIPAELWLLAGAMRQALVACAIEADTRPYLPHITLARKQNRPSVSEEFPANHWSISQFSLIESVTEPTGVRYCVLRSWALGSE